MNKISVVISAYNEEEKIEECLASASFADEVILIDGKSSDKTAEIAKKYGAKVFQRENNPMLNVNKNFGFEKATGDWLISIDADERITDELKKEIKLVVNKKDEISGYWIPRKNIIFGKWIKNAGWYPDHQLRLFKKRKGKFAQKHVHEMIEVDGKTEYLNGPLVHHNYDSISQFLKKLSLYTQNEAEQLIESGYKFSWQDAVRMPLKEFLSRFFARKGYLDGLHGLVVSLFMAFYHFVIFANIWEKNKFADYNNDQFLADFQAELTSSRKDLNYWVNKEKSDYIKNPARKALRKIINRVTAN